MHKAAAIYMMQLYIIIEYLFNNFNTQHGHTSFPDASECRVIYVGVCCSGIPAWCWCVLGVCPLLLVDGEQWAHVYACKYLHVYYMYICILPGFCLPGCTHTKMHTHAHPTYIWEQLYSTGTSDYFRFSCPASFAFFFLPLPRLRWCEAGCSGQLCSSTSPSLRSAQGGGIQSSFGLAG